MCGIVRKTALAAAIALCALPAFAGQPGPLVVIVRDLPPAELTTRVQARCLQRGMTVEQASETQVVCSIPMDDSMKSMFIRALATPSYSTNPVYRYRITAIRIGNETTVAIDPSVSWANAYGQVTTSPITNKKARAQLQADLDGIKADWERKLASGGTPSPAGGAASVSSTPPPPPTAASPAPLPPGATGAKLILGQMQCFDNFRLVGESNGSAIFEATCKSGGVQLVTCRGMSCHTIQ